MLLLELLLRRLIKRIRELNFFKSIDTDNDIHIQQNQIISTRIYIFLWITSIMILSIYNGFTEKKSTFEIDSSSMSVINEFQSKNLDEFTCPCSKIVIPYQTFTSFNTISHQVNWCAFLLKTLVFSCHISNRSVQVN